MADASEEFRRVFTGALEEESGLELAAETGDGQETVRLAKELSPDIVVMDFVLARMDGLEVLSELAALPGRPRVLVLSSFATASSFAGANYYKPLSVSETPRRKSQRSSPPTMTSLKQTSLYFVSFLHLISTFSLFYRKKGVCARR